MKTQEHRSYVEKHAIWLAEKHAKPSVWDRLVLILVSSIMLGFIGLVAYEMYLLG
jgi:polyferredoxin